MVAYSFQPRFEASILARIKRHTIRGPRKRHARPGEDLQLYVGMRTKSCRLIARTECVAVLPITIMFDKDTEYEGVISPGFGFGGLDEFARKDGFADWQDLKAFWRQQHPDVDEFQGFVIQWGDLR